MSAQRRRNLHRLFGRSTTALPDLTPPPPLSDLSVHPTPTQRSLWLANSSIPTQYVSGLFHLSPFQVYWGGLGMQTLAVLSSLVTQLSGFSEIIDSRGSKTTQRFYLFLLAGEEYTDRCVTGFGLLFLSLGDSRLLVLMFQTFCNLLKGQIECSDAAPFSVTCSQLSQDPGIHARPGRRGYQRRVLQGLQSVERRHPTRNHAHHGRRGRHHDQFRTQW